MLRKFWDKVFGKQDTPDVVTTEHYGQEIVDVQVVVESKAKPRRKAVAKRKPSRKPVPKKRKKR